MTNDKHSHNANASHLSPTLEVSKRMDINRREFLKLVAATPLLKVDYEIPKEWKGSYCFGAEVESFTLSASGLSFWLVGPKKVIDKLRKMHSRMTDAPYDVIEVVLLGLYADCERDGFAESYDGLFFVEEIV